ncbi:unnamed protein product (macronuclear) [Paramecium tetraurelia]|uniref:Uncharacterized protein n=1 Tax=Paramecium tetraurelia TaxID=5888 RepID=A0DY07_PARTE|nr:uncharacterized protein GSPATT00021548001 [Paramecium tetraurelia]CAK87924.1 unnamed protein product [Paramecium tetraurelia]|eukprot:XP_001455321.1 hypothetical protein (macronuclear) [Paramecium tetraurelia strain d4-2]
MEKITKLPLSFLQSLGDTQPLIEEEEMIPIQLKNNRFNHQKPLRCVSPFEKKSKATKKRCGHVILTDQLHQWNNFLHQKFQKGN